MCFLNIAVGAVAPTGSTDCPDQGVCGMPCPLTMTYVRVTVLWWIGPSISNLFAKIEREKLKGGWSKASNLSAGGVGEEKVNPEN